MLVGDTAWRTPLTTKLRSPKLAVLALIWSFLHHFCAGVRHLWMDATHSVSKEFGRQSSLAVFAVSLVLTLVFAAKLFGLY